MSLHYVDETLSRAEALAERGDLAGAYREMRAMPLADFLSLPVDLPRDRFPALARIVATMPPAEVQMRWTGHAGQALLSKTCGTMRLMQLQSFLLRGRDLGAGPILDYGCGWGRMMRGLGYFVEPDQIHGADPMEASLDACRNHGVVGTLHKVPLKPSAEAIGVTSCDLIFSYSVMTHTPQHVTQDILAALRPLVAADGAYVTTIRPVEFWSMRAGSLGAGVAERLIGAHHEQGYAYVPLGGGGELDKDSYGDASYSVDVFAALAAAAGWRIGRLDRDTLEPYQITVSLLPA